MKAAVRIIASALRLVWDDLFNAVVVNLLWLFSILLVIPGPPATLAMFYYANRLANGEVADIADFWTGLRRYWGIGWRWGLIAFGVAAFLYADFVLTGRFSGPLIPWIQGLYLTVLTVWGVIQVYALAFLFEQEDPSIRQALRNSAVMLGKTPVFSVLLGVLLGALLLIGTPVFMLTFVIGGILVSIASNFAVIGQLAKQKAAV